MERRVDASAHRRIEASRVARRCPSVIAHLRSGALTLSALAQVRHYIEEANVDLWVSRLAGKSRRHIEQILADLAPAPDAPTLLRRLPPAATPPPSPATPPPAAAGTTPTPSAATTPPSAAPATPPPSAATTPPSAAAATPTPSAATTLPTPAPATPTAPAAAASAATTPPSAAGTTLAPSTLPSASPAPSLLPQTQPVPPPPSPPSGRIEPLGEARWKLQLMMKSDAHEKLQRAQALMRHRNPSGDLAVVFEAALDALLERLEEPRRPASQRRAGDAAAPRATGAISRSTRRAVFARDGERCTFVSADGERCPATTLLEIDHILARARGGSGEASNLRVRCRAHNRLHAERDFGRAHVERRIHEAKARSRTSTVEVKYPDPDIVNTAARDGP